jgi:succinate dehydrogenase hydrophobic anchor subunit
MTYSHSFNKRKYIELAFCIILIIFFILGLDLPEGVKQIIDTLPMKIVLLGLIVYIFLYSSAIIAVLFLLVILDLMLKSSILSNSLSGPHELQKQKVFANLNQKPYTLEQEIVKIMAPRVNSGKSVTTALYLPLSENDHDASTI